RRECRWFPRQDSRSPFPEKEAGRSKAMPGMAERRGGMPRNAAHSVVETYFHLRMGGIANEISTAWGRLTSGNISRGLEAGFHSWGSRSRAPPQVFPLGIQGALVCYSHIPSESSIRPGSQPTRRHDATHGH